MMYNPTFLEFINDVLKKEGGYVNDPSDSGGETNWGITRAVARQNGYTGPMKDMPRNVAVDIYYARFWASVRGDEIARMSPSIALKIADIAVNMGVGRAGEFTQRLLNVFNLNEKTYPDLVVDGDIGKKSVSALKSFLDLRGGDGELVFIRGLNCLQGSFYVTLAERRAKDESFVFGWLLNRIA